eukprot:767387-Hanusia_phi.AAC.2
MYLVCSFNFPSACSSAACTRSYSARSSLYASCMMEAASCPACGWSPSSSFPAASIPPSSRRSLGDEAMPHGLVTRGRGGSRIG